MNLFHLKFWFIPLTIVVSGLISFLSTPKTTSTAGTIDSRQNPPFLVVLGIAQDGGYPQISCRKSCCLLAWENPELRRYVSSLAIVDPQTAQRWIIDATPDFKEQLYSLDQVFPPKTSPGINGIFLTHAHIGHYTGLIHLGREALGTRNVPVYVMPRMHEFLNNNGPWNQLVQLENIVLHPLRAHSKIKLNEHISITPFLVPHRGEYTETVGYLIEGPNRSALFIPDIDKWEKWDVPIESLIAQVAVAYLDGTFFNDEEIPGRNMQEIPHPFVIESIERFEALPGSQKSKIRFIHLNHTNPALISGSRAREYIRQKGFHIAEEGEKFPL